MLISLWGAGAITFATWQIVSVGSFLRQLHMESGQGLDLQSRFAQDIRNDMEEGVRLLESRLSESEMIRVKDSPGCLL